jgi:hypothetical protein
LADFEPHDRALDEEEGDDEAAVAQLRGLPPL